MLTVDSLNVAIPLTSILDSNNLQMVAIPNSPLDLLVSATRSDSSFYKSINGNEVEIDTSGIVYIANAKDPVLNVSKHDVVMDDLVETISTAVKGHILFAKTVVAPAIEELATATITSLSERTPSSLLGMEVIVWTPPAPLLVPSFEDVVRKFEETPYDNPALKVKLPNVTFNELLDLMLSGSSNLDSAIKEWVAVKGETFFNGIWENIFQINPSEEINSAQKTFHDYVFDPVNGTDTALAIFLLSRKLADKVLPETEMNINAYNASMIEFRNQSGAKLSLAFDELNKIDKIQQLVKSTTKNTTVVNESVYRKWIEAGGENEVLFGNLLELPSAITVPEINDRADKLKASWNRHAALIATVERNRLFARTKEILSYQFQKQMREVPDGEEATIGNRETVVKMFNEQLDRVREDELNDIWTVCLKLVCRSRFCRTEAERILLGIERIKKENPTINIREAAAVSVIEYISYWLSTQMQVRAI